MKLGRYGRHVGDLLFDDLDLLLRVKLEIDPKFVVIVFGQNRQLQKYSSGATRWVLLGTRSVRTLVKID